MKTTRSPKSFGTTSCTIRIDGKVIDNSINVISVHVDYQVNHIATAELTLGEGDISSQALDVNDAAKFELGSSISISAGYDSEEKIIFKGVICSHCLEIMSDNTSVVNITCKAQANGFVAINELNKVAIDKSLADGSVPLVVTYGIDLLSFSAKVDSLNPLDSPANTSVRGRVSFKGNASARIDSLIELVGVGERYNDTHYIGGIHHSIENGQWITTAEWGQAQMWSLDVLESPCSGNNKKPYELTAVNHIKSFVTKSQMKVIFDDENSVMTLQTPDGNAIVISDKDKAITLTDQNNNSISMNENGIIIRSSKDITLSAKNSVHIESTNDTTVKATGDAKISGLNVTALANSELTLKGYATAELSCSGITTIKGALVKIN